MWGSPCFAVFIGTQFSSRTAESNAEPRRQEDGAFGRLPTEKSQNQWSRPYN